MAVRWPKLTSRRAATEPRTGVRMSVVVAVYNPGRYFEPCEASLLHQSMPTGEYEVIFVDDGSTDQTPARLDELAAKHANVTVIHIPNSGWPGKPRNVGIDASVGEYVYFVDHDDSLAPEALERMYAMAHRSDADIIIGKIAGHGRRVPRTLFRENRELCTLETAPLMESMTPHKGFRRAFLNEHGIRFPEGRRRLEDHVFVVEAYLRAEVVSVLSDYTCYHHIARDDGGNAGLSRLVPKGYFANLRDAIDVAERLTEPGPLRDLVMRRWYNVEMLNRVGGKAFVGYSPAYRREIYDEVRVLALQRFTSPGIWAELGPQYRVRSELLRADRFEDLVRLAEFETGLGLTCRLEQVGWSSGALALDLTLMVEQSDGSPALVRSGGGWVLDVPIPGVSEPSRALGAPVGDRRAEVLLRHRETKRQFVLAADVADQRAADQPEAGLRCRATVTFDPTTVEGTRLADGVWDIFVRLLDWGAGPSLTRRVGSHRAESAEGPLLPALLGSPPRVAIPYWTVAGNLSIDLDQRTKSLVRTVAGAAGQVTTTGSVEGLDVSVPLPIHLGPGVTMPVRLPALDENGRFDILVSGAISLIGEEVVLTGKLPAFTPPCELAFDTTAQTSMDEVRLGVRFKPDSTRSVGPARSIPTGTQMRNPKMIKVSVVVPVYNAGEYLEPCITSLLGQTMPADELELIFVDDGSTDDSLTRLNRLAAEHSHVRVISIENSGWPGKPRNIGSTAARGDYVQFVDQDDYLGLEALARTHALAAASGADVAIGKMVGVGRWTPTRLFRETRTDATLDNCDLVASLTPHKMFRRQFLLDQDILFPEGKRRLEDFVFVMRCYVAAQAICVLADYPCYFYTRRADGQNTSFQRIEPDVYFENLSEVIDVVYAAIPEGSRRDAVLERFYRSEILRRLSEPNVLTTPEDFVHELFRSSRKAAADLFADSTRRSLAPVLRARAELLRRGSALELVEFAQRLSGIKASVSATKAVWRGETLRVHVEAKLVLNGRPLRIVDGADGLVLDPALTDGLPEARPLIVGENADNVRDGVSLELLIRDRDTSIDWPVPCNVHVELARMEGLKGSRFAVVRGYGDLDPTTLAGGLPLVRGSWDVSVRVSMWGLHRTTRLAVGDGLELETLVRLVGSPAVSVLPYATAPHGNLTLDVGHRRKRIQLPAAVKIETSTTDGAVRSMVRRVLPSRLRRAIHRAR